jgi:hypothetical protein
VAAMKLKGSSNCEGLLSELRLLQSMAKCMTQGMVQGMEHSMRHLVVFGPRGPSNRIGLLSELLTTCWAAKHGKCVARLHGTLLGTHCCVQSHASMMHCLLLQCSY